MARFLNMDPITSSSFSPFEIGSSLGSKDFIFEDPIIDPSTGVGSQIGSGRRAQQRPELFSTAPARIRTRNGTHSKIDTHGCTRKHGSHPETVTRIAGAKCSTRSAADAPRHPPSAAPALIYCPHCTSHPWCELCAMFAPPSSLFVSW
jgi:hypothetical protein